jgi:glycosyltransferase involved in cell wall biosynthesis
VSDKPLRVLFLTLYPDTAASPRYRVHQFLPYLRDHGVECTVASALSSEQFTRLTGPERQLPPFWYHLAETPARLKQILGARRYDVVFLQKAITTAYIRGFPGLLRSRARHIVYDFDDAVHLQPPHPLRAPWSLFEDRRQIERILARADRVLAGNAWLRSEAERFGAKAECFPTVVDTDRFRPLAKPDDPYRIGWMGNPSTAPSLQFLVPTLQAVEEAEIVIVGADRREFPDTRFDLRPWVYENEVSDIQRFSVGLMPLPDTDWSRGKCALKAFQYMVCGVPCIASPIGFASEIITHGENGLLADSPQQWFEAIEWLREPNEHKRIGDAGRETVEERFSLAEAAPRMLALLESIA